MCACARVACQRCLCVSLDWRCGAHLDGRITGIVSNMERLEARRVNFKETYEKQRVDVMSISRELQHTESSLKQKVGEWAWPSTGVWRRGLHLLCQLFGIHDPSPSPRSVR